MMLALLLLSPAADAPKRPNILWLTCEDISCNLGCYGDRDAVTPRLDAFARQGTLYANAFSIAGVCAPSRSCLITGIYPSTLGSQYMRCKAELPKGITTFTVPLRKAGYYCTNNVKTDYNFTAPKEAWDDSSRKAHYRGRGKGQPFFAVFNNVVTHESRIRTPEAAFKRDTARLAPGQRHDPAKVAVPPYHPDVPAVRRDWARYHDLITAMDKWAGDKLDELDKAGLADDTIVFFYSDHGAGLPRGKRWLYDTGMKVPLLVRFGKNFAHLAPTRAGATTKRLASFVDFGPTVLSLAGVAVPAPMQGVPFLGKAAGKPREAVFGIRDRMDERNDCSRAVRDARWKYIRNYQWWKPWAQPLNYMELMPTMAAWRKLKAAGNLEGGPALWMRDRKLFEELYDLAADPHELNNLAGDKKHEGDLRRLRGLHLDWYKRTRDLGLMPEALVWGRSKEQTRYEMGQDPKAFPSARLREAAERIAHKPDLAALRSLLADEDAAVRWWGATGLGLSRADGAKEALTKALAGEKSATVRVALAAALSRLDVLREGLKDKIPWVRHAAMLALDEMGPKAAPARKEIEAALKDANPYVGRVAEHWLKGKGKE